MGAAGSAEAMNRFLSMLAALAILLGASTIAPAMMSAPRPIDAAENKEELLRFIECHPDLMDRALLKVFRHDVYSVIRMEGSDICENGDCPTMVYKPNDKNNRCGLNVYAGGKISFPDVLGPVQGRNSIMIFLNGNKHTLEINVLFDPPVLMNISEVGTKP
jgi:hypothetical protein